jgi:signal transduction histidine kinase
VALPVWEGSNAVSNVIAVPWTGKNEGAAHASGHPHAGPTLRAEPGAHSHGVQFYEAEAFLLEAVGDFLAAGLLAGDHVLVVATGGHRQGFTRRLEGVGAKQATATGRLTLLDAREVLSEFMVGEMPDADLFRGWIAQFVSAKKGEGLHPVRIRVFGEMVDVLWRDGNHRAAIRLEELWSDAIRVHSFSLLCAYVMGNFYKESDQAPLLEICKNHSHVIPTETFAQIDDRDACLREIALLQQRARALESEIQHRKNLESALRDALAERARAEEQLRGSVEREREARAKAEASDAFKEMFLGILGHDLRNPLNTVLMTARLMTMRRELPPEGQKKLERVVASGERMQRMIEQLLDLTGARLAGGIAVTRTKQDLVPLVSKIVDEIRLANPTRAIEFCPEGACEAYADGDRFEQVVSNLLDNAVKHGDPQKAIRVVVAARGSVASLSVHNYGTPIDPAFMPLLFDPFERAGRAQSRSDGLGLGLYISERIVVAHGGKIEVESSTEMGTRFEAIFPRHE